MQKDVLKVVLLGDGGVGKTSLRNQFMHKRFASTYQATIGADFISKEVQLEDGNSVMLQIWDTAGQERFRSLGVAFYRGSDACVLVYDVNNYLTFEHLEHWYRDFCTQAGITQPETFPFILLGNKIDLDTRVVSPRQAKHFSEQLRRMPIPVGQMRGGWGGEGHHSGALRRRQVVEEVVEIPCFEASAKEGTNVEKVFTHIAKMVKVPKLEFEMDQDVIPGDTISGYDRGKRSCCWG